MDDVYRQHSIFKDNLEELKRKMFSQQAMNQGFNIQITEQLYVQNLYELHEEQVNEIFRNHFGILSVDFVATYHETFEDANGKISHKSRASSSIALQNIASEMEGAKRSNTLMINKIASNMKKAELQKRISAGLDVELQAMPSNTTTGGNTVGNGAGVDVLAQLKVIQSQIATVMQHITISGGSKKDGNEPLLQIEDESKEEDIETFED